MTDNVYHAGARYFRRDAATQDEIARFRRDVFAQSVAPARWVELLDVLLRDRRNSRGPGMRLLQGTGAMLFAVAAAIFVPYPWTFVMSVPAGCVAMWWLAISVAHYRNTERARVGAQAAQAELEQADGLLWRFESLLLSMEHRAGIRLFDTLLPTSTASKNATLRAIS